MKELKISSISIFCMTDHHYMRMFNRLFSNENRMSSTYKPVFLRALLDIGNLHNKGDKIIGDEWLERKEGKIRVDLNFIAARFAKYYWDMEYSFHLRQSQDPQDANITRIIKEIHNPKKKPPTIEQISHECMAGFRKIVIKKSLKPEVLIHLKTDMNDLYQKISPNVIELDEGVIEFLFTNKILLKKSLNHMISKYLEKLNRMTPQIAHKVESDVIKRKPLKTTTALMLERHQDTRCFYCSNKFVDYHVDHVIPYNYVFSTDTYNCVLACQQCNCTKSDCLPHEDIFNNVLKRNYEISERLEELNSGYNENSYIRMFESCIDDYSGNNFFKPS